VNDLIDGEAAWPRELARHLQESVSELLRPRVAASAAEIDREQRQALDDLGYGDR
jgi:hypothetical protein